MLRKAQRLSRKEFLTYFKQGKRFHTPAFQLIYSPHERFHGAVVVGKKVAKKATSRNRLRRQVYGRLYRQGQRHNLTGVFILIVKPSAAALSKTALTDAVEAVIGQVGKKG